MRGEIRDGFSFWILKNYIDIDRKDRIIMGTGQLCESFAQLPCLSEAFILCVGIRWAVAGFYPKETIGIGLC